MDLVAELAAITRALEGASVEYALCGGLAVAVHGHVRATKDIDLLVRPEACEAALRVVEALGYDVRAHPMTFDAGSARERRVQRVSKLTPGAPTTVDFLLVGPALESAWSGRELYAWEGASLSVVSREGLLAMKRLAGRAQDLADIARLEGSTDEG